MYDSTLEIFFQEAKRNPNFAIMAPYVQEKNDINIKIDSKKSTSILINNVKGFAMFLNISEFKDIGFFDESFFLYFEDIDLCKRLNDNNKKIFLVSNLKINHLGAQSSSEDISWERELTRNWHWMWSTFYYHKKHSGFFISLLQVLPKLISAIFKFIIYSVLKKNKKKKIYLMRFLGLVNAIKGKSSWYRPKV